MSVQRYRMSVNAWGDILGEESKTGEWVKWDDLVDYEYGKFKERCKVLGVATPTKAWFIREGIDELLEG